MREGTKYTKRNKECELSLVLDFPQIETNASTTTSDCSITDENRSQVDASDSWGPRPPKLCQIANACTNTFYLYDHRYCYSYKWMLFLSSLTALSLSLSAFLDSEESQSNE
ncbi:hypothetical protein MRB53_029147 [Persea americana]|uniref:Uncharacterized protein n=1 Tax=Persea americana TaxID=3435 RepID=A0ACC2KHQ2_PERAE|nr:hypothetical protein MRB53_029147 [Persea americana]